MLRIHNAKLAALGMKGGKTKYEAVKMSLFVAETEQFIGSNLDFIGKIDMLKIEEQERGDGRRQVRMNVMQWKNSWPS